MDNKFIKQKLDKFDENVSLPNSLKAENLFSLIENITPDEPIALPEKKVLWFNKKYVAVAAMFVLVVGFAVFYRNIPKPDILQRDIDLQGDTDLSESAPKMSNDEAKMFALNSESEESEEYSKEEGFTGGGALKSTPRVRDEMNEFAAEEYAEELDIDWDFYEGTLYQNDKKIFKFPNSFIVKDYYSYADSLIFYGEKELDGQSPVYIFKKDEDGNFKISQSFRQEGSILDVYIFEGRVAAISIDNDSTLISSYVNSFRKGLFRCNFAVDYGDIYPSKYGVAISDGHQVVYSLNENAGLLREIEIDKGKYIESIEIQEKNIVVFLSNGETLDFPIKK